MNPRFARASLIGGAEVTLAAKESGELGFLSSVLRKGHSASQKSANHIKAVPKALTSQENENNNTLLWGYAVCEALRTVRGTLQRLY